MKKTALLWLLAFLFTLALAAYQRLSGPTYPVRGTENLAGAEVNYKFYRSWTSGRGLPVQVTISGDKFSAQLYYRRFPLINGENWSISSMVKNGHIYTTVIPTEPPAGKIIYKVRVRSGSREMWLNHGQPVVARFKSEVPVALLIAHVIFMFVGLLLAFRTGLEALRKDGRWEKLVPWTLAVVFLGGLIMGPMVQYYAFGSLWTGFPLGNDLTDSKTFLVVVLWVIAFFLRKKSRWWTLVATGLMIAVYFIPHSLRGSELDYKSQQIKTGYFHDCLELRSLVRPG